MNFVINMGDNATECSASTASEMGLRIRFLERERNKPKLRFNSITIRLYISMLKEEIV